MNGQKTYDIYLQDGSMFSTYVDVGGEDVQYFINGKREKTVRKYFCFQSNKLSNRTTGTVNAKYFIEPYTNTWNGKYAQLKSGNQYSCNKQSTPHPFCTKLLMENGWKITDDYPW